MRETTQHMSLQEMIAEFKGEIFGGTVVDTSKENPVVKPKETAPNIIVSEEDADEYQEGDVINGIKITTVKKSYMFGEKIQQESKDSNGSASYVVEYTLGKNKMESESYKNEEEAQDWAEFLSEKLNVGTVEVVRQK